MSVIVLPRRRWPPSLASLSISDRYRTGLRDVFMPHLRGADPFGSNSTAWTENGSPVYRAGTVGSQALQKSGTTSGVYKAAAGSNADEWTALIYFRVLSVGATQGIFQYATTSASSSSPRALYQNDNGTLRLYEGSSYVGSETGAGAAGTIHCVAIRHWMPVGVRSFDLVRNGRSVLIYATASGSNTGSHVWFGNGYSGSADIEIFFGAWWENYRVPINALCELTADPASLFTSRRRQIYVPAGGGGTTSTGVGISIGASQSASFGLMESIASSVSVAIGSADYLGLLSIAGAGSAQALSQATSAGLMTATADGDAASTGLGQANADGLLTILGSSSSVSIGSSAGIGAADILGNAFSSALGYGSFVGQLVSEGESVAESVGGSNAAATGALALLGEAFSVGAATSYGDGSILATGESIATAVGSSNSAATGLLDMTGAGFGIGSSQSVSVALRSILADAYATGSATARAGLITGAYTYGTMRRMTIKIEGRTFNLMPENRSIDIPREPN